MGWFFRKLVPGEKSRDPIAGEFFATEAITNPARALIREGIQNALDASTSGAIQIRVLLATGQDALPPERAARWFEGSWDHLHADRNGLREAPLPTDSCPFLVFEDFGTSGLIGDVHQEFDEGASKNAFFYFFRAEGRTGKSESDRGRWGVGKQVFPRASHISTIFGLTHRDGETAPILMGNTILKSHRVREVHFSPDGYFGVRPAQLVLPTADADLVEDFVRDFRIRRNGEPGLSIVVPYVDEDIQFDNLKQAILAEYFFPILQRKLRVPYLPRTEGGSPWISGTM